MVSVYTYIQINKSTHFDYVQLIVNQFYLNESVNKYIINIEHTQYIYGEHI